MGVGFGDSIGIIKGIIWFLWCELIGLVVEWVRERVMRKEWKEWEN